MKSKQLLLKKELNQANITKNRLFDILDQEMRKPILVFRGISKKINFLVNRKEYNTIKKLGQQLDKEAVSINLLFQNLLVWAKNQKDTLKYDPQPIPCKLLVQEVSQTFLPLAQEKDIHFSSDFSESAHINADFDSLLLLLKNILYQTLQEVPPNQEVQLLLTPEANQIHFNINGISEDSDLQKLNVIPSNISPTTTTIFDAAFTKQLIQLNRGTFQFLINADTLISTLQLSFPRA